MAAPYKNDVAKKLDAEVGAQIKAARISMGISQFDLARLSGITQQMLCRYESGRQSIAAHRLYRISLALGCSMDFFFAAPTARISKEFFLGSAP